MLVVGPWLQRLIAPRLRNYEFTRGGFPPGVFVPLTGAFVLFTVYQLLAGLFTDTVICVARNRQGATYEIRSAPQMFWWMVLGLFVRALKPNVAERRRSGSSARNADREHAGVGGRVGASLLLLRQQPLCRSL